VVCERAQAWTDRAAPWFCVVSLEPPHPPYDEPSGSVIPRSPAEIVLAPNVPRDGEVEARARKELSGYYAHIEATDRAIGRLIEAMSRDNTIVVFTSAHGDMHGAHGLFRKGWPHEESVRVPLLVRHPRIAARKDEHAVSLVQLAALTVAWAEGNEAGVGTPDASSISMPSIVALPHQCDRSWRGIRTPTRKLVLNGDGSPWLYFDLDRDPFEMENLVTHSDRQTEIIMLRAQLSSIDHGA
jgi:arylsulfatase A-like enzyme